MDNSNEKQEDNNEEEVTYIDPDDLIIIRDPSTWTPSQEQIIGYANQLEFDLEIFRDDAKTIAYKYLLKKTPDKFVRAFTKVNPQLIYIDITTNEIHLSSILEDQAKEEYKELTEHIRQNPKKLRYIPREK